MVQSTNMERTGLPGRTSLTSSIHTVLISSWLASDEVLALNQLEIGVFTTFETKRALLTATGSLTRVVTRGTLFLGFSVNAEVAFLARSALGFTC